MKPLFLKASGFERGTSALVLLLPGLGDALTATPVLAGAIARADWDVDVLTMLPAVSAYVRSLTGVRNVIEIPMLEKPLESLLRLIALRKRKYDVCIVPFPATRWQYVAVARFVGPKMLFAHDYGGLSRLIASAGRHSLNALRGGHRYFENQRLANSIGLPSSADDAPRYLMPIEWQGEAQTWLLGVHAGSMVYKGNEVRRWPAGEFVNLIARQLKKGRRVRLFVGPHERDTLDAFSSLIGHASFEIIDKPLDDACQAIAQCKVFLANDAGLSHVAAGLQVNTITLFGMTDPTRAQPVGRSVALRPSLCPPCHDEGLRTFSCVRNIGFECIREDLTVEQVDALVDAAFAADFGEALLVKEGPFRLYGRHIEDRR